MRGCSKGLQFGGLIGRCRDVICWDTAGCDVGIELRGEDLQGETFARWSLLVGG